MPTVIQLACPAIPQVRIALIGLGQRGIKTLERYAFIPDARLVCVADLRGERTAVANQRLRATGRPEAEALSGEDAWQRACMRDDVDLVYICTDWRSHTEIALEAMRRGKHVAVEVPAATTVADCWRLVRTAEETRRHLFMTENCCYDLFALETLEMHRRGCFGQITHCEGGYIHCLTEAATDPNQQGTFDWIESACIRKRGNAYPTHGMGPIAQLLGFHDHDRMETLTSISSVLTQHDGGQVYPVNTSLIQTRRGVSIVLQLDVTTPRPYSRLQTICGTLGFAQKYPVPTLQLRGGEALTGEAALRALAGYDTSEALKLWREGEAKGVPNAMNYAMDARLIHCLTHGLPLDIDAYDAAEWSCLTELSRLSAEQGGMPVSVPDFRGAALR